MVKKSPLPQAIDRELADLAAAVYDNNVMQVGKWTRIFDAAPNLLPAGVGPTSKPDATSGFKAAVYRKDSGEHALAFCGSEREARDWLTNLGQGLGMDTSQYRQASAFASECKVQFGDSLVLTGHSLGGGLAAIASATTNTPAVTFNPAGVHRKTLERAGVDPEGFQRAAENGLIRKYVVKGEVVSRVNSLPFVPKAPGAQIVLQDPQKAWMLNKHSMTTMLSAMDNAAMQSVVATEASLPHKDLRAAEMAVAFRKSPATEGVKSFPGLATAYRVLEATEAKAAGLPPATAQRLLGAMRENLARRIENGEPINAPKQQAALAHNGPER